MSKLIGHRRIGSILLLLNAALFLIFVLSCGGSSDTRSQAKSSTSGEFEVNVQITSPVDGAVVTFADGESNVTFTAAASGGTEPRALTWQTEGPTSQNTSTGETATITFLETGTHTVTVTATDARGLTATDAITITVSTGTGLSTSSTTTTTTTNTSATTTTTTTATTTT